VSGLSFAVDSSLVVPYDSVSDLCTHSFSVSACKIDSSSVSSVVSTLSTSALEMNNAYTVPFAPVEAVQQVKFSDAALNSVIIPKTKHAKSHFHISCILKGCHCTIKVAAMVNPGATVLFINKKYANSQKVWQVPLTQQIHLHNIDRTLNEAGSITHKVSLALQVGQDKEKFDFFVTSLGPEKVILGLPWLCHRNPAIDWQAGTLCLNSDQRLGSEPVEVEVMCIMANRMEHHCLLMEKVLDTSQDDIFCFSRLHLLTSNC
jgi:hypothetical protein